MAITKIDVSLLEDVGGANNLVKLDSNAKIPAGSAGGLSVKPGPFTSTSDPTISSNKALGFEWLNKTSGEMYICTDATVGSNVWTNVGAGSGDVAPWSFGGTNFGYCSGSFAAPAPYSRDWIQKYAFASDADAIDSGNLTTPNWGGAGIGSRTHGYCAGGYYHNNGGAVNVIDKFPFAAGGNAVDVGDLTVARNNMSATSDKETYAYVGGGQGNGSPSNTNVIDRFSLSADGNATDVGDLSAAVFWCASASTNTYGYICHARLQAADTNVIERYAHSASGNATDVGDLHASNPGGTGTTGITSDTHGYFIRSVTSNPAGSDIQKYALASSANGTLVGDSHHTGTANHQVGASATTHGYLAGYSSTTNAIERFSLSSDGNATAVGDMVYVTGEGSSGTEY